MKTSGGDFVKEYMRVWDEGALKDAPFITLGVEAILTDYYGDLLDAPAPFAVREGSRILDLGCGWGRVLKPVLDGRAQAVGLDISEKMLRAAREHCAKHRHAAPLVQGDGTALPFKDRSFDGAYSLLVLQHLSKENGRLTIGEISRVLKSGGEAYIRVPGRFAPENLLFALLQFISINILRVKDPIRMRFYRIGEMSRVCREFFSHVEITAHEFRPPWNFHTRWTWQYIIVPRRFHRALRRVSDRIERLANGRFGLLKHLGVVLMVRAVK
jgi:ubiquinone/menaquinone biosynthesis C-methylase UbiE